MIERTLTPSLLAKASKFPAVLVTGPRQSGKTTLCRSAFPHLPYVSFEAPDVRSRALEDPRGLLQTHRRGAIFDEVQRVPELLSYVQGEVDADPSPGRFVLTGSQQLNLRATTAQTLAGRVAILELLPFGLEELRRAGRVGDLWTTIWMGGYPPIHDRDIPAGDWLGSYVGTYVERDVRQQINVTDLIALQTFLRLCAGRTGQLLNLSQLGADAGISHNTAKSWMSALEASFLSFRLMPFAKNAGKRLVKTPKLQFIDTGLACWLLGIRSPAELEAHPLRGALFESWVAAEILKSHVHRFVAPRLSFYRDAHGLEADVLIEAGPTMTVVESKSGATVPADAFAPIEKVGSLVSAAFSALHRVIVYGGAERFTHRGTLALPWAQLDGEDWLKASPELA